MPSADAVTRSLSEVEKYQHCRAEVMDPNDSGYVLSIPVPPMRRGGSDTHLELERSTSSASSSASYAELFPDFRRGRSRHSSLQQKLLKVTEQLKIEQTARDENVAEYLKLVNSADKQQVPRIRQVFEKKNQKSMQTIASLQRKLEQYHRRMRDCESNHHTSTPVSTCSTTNSTPSPSTSRHNASNTSNNASPSCSMKHRFRDSTPDGKGGSPRVHTGSGRHPTLDKIKTIGPGVSLSPPFFFSKPREFANLIRNKFGSADNIAHLKTSLEVPASFRQEGETSRALSSSASNMADKQAKYACSDDDECSTGTSVSADSNGNPLAPPADSHGLDQGQVELLMEEIREIHEAQSSLAEDIEALKEQFKTDYDFLNQSLQEEGYRYERLEYQLNDLTELHQNEMSNLKQVLASIEEKVAYQANERARDLTEALETCQTRVAKLELQQQQQQAVQWEGSSGGGDARVLLGRCINILLALATVVLVCVSTAAKFAGPMLRSRLHLLATSLGLLLLAFCWKHWEQLQCALERLLLPA